MPPARIRKMNEDLEALSIYLAEERDLILVRKQLPAKFIRELSDILGYELATFKYDHIADIESITYRFLKPWGWSPQAHKALSELKKYGNKDYQQHPSLDWSERSRFIAGKGVVAEFLPYILSSLPPVKADIAPRIIKDIDTLYNEVTSRSCVVKAPWSSSGKGVRFMIHNKMEKMELEWAHGVFKQQGFVTAAQYVEKIQDFAMQFYMDKDGKVTYRGLSLFFTNDYGQYQGNYILSDVQIEDILCKYVSKAELEQVKEALVKSLSELISQSYIGYFGVDMMIFKDEDQQPRIHPMVEINLRNNMGILAACIREKIVASGSSGKYYVAFESDPSCLRQKVSELENQYPAEFSAGKVRKGFFRLTPNYDEAQYIAYIIID
ncbi:MAG: hypothetical protein ACRCXN_04165 [Bacteroidales bacterium]